MRKKGILVRALGVLLIGVISVIFYNYKIKSNEIKIMNYRASEEMEAKGYQINKYDDQNAIAWLNENEILTTKDKNENNEYLSIYNVNTKESKDFDEVTMNYFYGVSKNGKYALYGRFKSRSLEDESEELKDYSEETQNVIVKLLNLETGESTNLKTQYNNMGSSYSWISDDKILVICNSGSSKWQIININGDICLEGQFEFADTDNSAAYLAGIDELKDLGDTVEGKFYYTTCFRKGNNSIFDKIFSIDVNTKKEEVINEDAEYDAEKRGSSILMSYFDNNGQATDGVHVNRTFGFRVFDKSGNIIQNQQSPLGSYCDNCKLSSDGSKVSYIEKLDDLSIPVGDISDSTVLKVLDIKSGDIKEISKLIKYKENDLDESTKMSISDLMWDESGISLMFTIEYLAVKKQVVTLSEIGKEIYQTDEDIKEISVIDKPIKHNTYIITFDR